MGRGDGRDAQRIVEVVLRIGAAGGAPTKGKASQNLVSMNERGGQEGLGKALVFVSVDRRLDHAFAGVERSSQ